MYKISNVHSVGDAVVPVEKSETLIVPTQYYNIYELKIFFQFKHFQEIFNRIVPVLYPIPRRMWNTLNFFLHLQRSRQRTSDPLRRRSV